MKNLILLLLFSGMLLNTASAQWEVKYPDSTSTSSSNLKVIRFHDDSLGLAMGSNSGILRSTDQGENWEKINIDYLVRFEDMQFINADTIVSVGVYQEENGDNLESKFIRSTDGGLSWDSIGTIYDKQLSALHFFNASSGLVCGSRGIYKTNDNGISWDTVYSVYQEGYSIGVVENISFINDQTGFACMYGAASLPVPLIDNLILKTIDAGQSWTTLANLEDRSYSIEFYDDSVGYISHEHALSKTENGGINWTEVISEVGGYGQIYTDIHFRNDSTTFFAGAPTIIIGDDQGDIGFTFLKTTNGASNWNIIDTLRIGLASVDFITDSIGFITSGGYILKTTTCGGPVIGIPSGGPPSSLNKLNNEIDLSVYPNPTDNLIHIDLKNNMGKSVTIYNTLGQKLKHLAFNGSTFSFSAKDFPKGNYWLLVETETGYIVRQFMKT